MCRDEGRIGSQLGFRGFFFSSRRRHTRFDCDWSSDVCSSDLHSIFPTEREQEIYLNEVLASGSIPMQIEVLAYAGYHYPIPLLERMANRYPLDRKSVV